MDHDALAKRFLKTLWRLQGGEGYAVVAVKSPTGKFLDIVTDDPTDAEWANDPFKRRGDIYFTPCLFNEPNRRNESALPSRLLYADLDDVDPNTLALRPTIAIESSPGRWQGIWVLTRPLPVDKFRALNQRLTYATGADKGGWFPAKILRVPGTRNRKYPDSPRVRLAWFNKDVYSPQEVLDFIKGEADTYTAPAVDSTLPMLPNTTAAHLRKRYKRKLGRRALKLLTVRTVTKGEDRSARMWELENLCLDAGMTAEETLLLVQSCAYNKYAGQRREVRMLWTEISKAVAVRERREAADLGSEPDEDAIEAQEDREDDDSTDRAPAKLEPTRLARYLAKDVRPPSWLVEEIWGRSAYGVWAGDFKTYKSTLLMDLAISVSSGRPFLGKFAVHRTGPVLYIQEENSHGFMHDRLHRIVQAKGLGNAVHPNGRPSKALIEFGHDLDLQLLNLSGFDLTNEKHLTNLAEWCARYHPALVILDPLYRMAPGIDENSQAEMAPILNPLADISNQTDTALILAHHYNKPHAGNSHMRSGHRISGTSVFSRWWVSSVYAERAGESDAYSIKFHNEHREHGSATPQVVTVEMDANDPDMYAIHLADTLEEEQADHEIEEDEQDGLKLDKRTQRVAVTTVRAALSLSSSRDAQRVLKAKGYTVKTDGKSKRLWAYPPERTS